MLYRTGKAIDLKDGASKILEKLKNGEALKKFKEMIIAQGVSKNDAFELCDKRNYKQVFKRSSKYVTPISSKKSGLFIKAIKII